MQNFNPRNIRILICLALLTCFIYANAQHQYVWKDILKTISSDTSELYIGEKDILVFDGRPWRYDKNVNYSLKDRRLNVNRKIVIENPKILFSGLPSNIPPSLKAEFDNLQLEDFNFNKSVEIELLNNHSLNIQNCIFQKGVYLNILGSVNRNVIITKNQFEGQLKVVVKNCDLFHLSENNFITRPNRIDDRSWASKSNISLSYIRQVNDTSKIYGHDIVGNDDLIEISVIETSFNALKNNFDCPTVTDIKFNINKSNDVKIVANSFKANLVLKGSINVTLDLTKNYFGKFVSLDRLILPTYTQIDWMDIKGKVAILGDTILTYQNIPIRYYDGADVLADSVFSVSTNERFLYYGDTREAVLNKSLYKKLIEIYKTLYDNARLKGDIESSNGYFVAVKDLEGNRYAALYKLNGGFKEYFNWKLNRLMKFYTNHATEPALALVVSVYFILGFAVFYFFFPSEWDIESKGKLIQHYKDFIQKNEKGYMKPFIKILWRFTISFFNALTLSLNSFVTLGFGNIPTKGLARYVCIIQGFIGWFLLSIFTVALFNQVLF